MIGQRIVVVGNTGTGKTTLARQLSSHTGLPHIELDALHWGPNWIPVDAAVFGQRISDVIQTKHWIIDGNYSRMREIIWRRADTIVWLDYALVVVLWRLFWRTIRRSIRRQLLWGTNRERLWTQFFSRDSLFIWALKKQWSRRRHYPALFKQPAYAHLQTIRLRSPQQTKHWLAKVTALVTSPYRL
jgi:adenylate kinase family enzyme